MSRLLIVTGMLAGEPGMTRIEELNGWRALFVDDRPFLILGLESDCDTPFALKISDPLCPQARMAGRSVLRKRIRWSESRKRLSTDIDKVIVAWKGDLSVDLPHANDGKVNRPNCFEP